MNVDQITALFPPGTTQQVQFATLASAKGAVKLEGLGMKHSSGRSARKHWAQNLGLKASALADDVVAALQAAMDTLMEDADR